ncbi:MAG TPA: hypothetical protein PLV68_20905, partial [Ilumatobacteraceae bacterium]|nr:hypothetical protein [Ilumatobacteraceae bacterium]
DDGSTLYIDPQGAPPAGPTPGYILDPQRSDRSLASLWSREWTLYYDNAERGTFHLWSEPDASFDVGRWLALTVTPLQGASTTLDGNRRVMVGAHPALVTPIAPGVVSVETWLDAASDGEGGVTTPLSVTAWASGIDLDAIAAVLADLLVVTRPDGAVDIAFAHAADVLPGLVPRQIEQAACCKLTGTDPLPGFRRVLVYRDDGEPTITVETTDHADDALAQLAGPLLTLRQADRFGVSAVGDRTIRWATTASHLPAESPLRFPWDWDGEFIDGISVAQWHDGSSLVTVAVAGDLAALLATVGDVTRASRAQWEETNMDAYVEQQRQERNALFDDPAETDEADAGFWGTPTVGGRLEVGATEWTLEVWRPDGKAGILRPATGGMTSDFGVSRWWTDLDADDWVHASFSASEVAIVVRVEHMPSAAAIRVTVPGREPVLRPLTVLDSGVALAFDVYTEIGQPTVELLDTAGRVFRGWT